VGNAARLAEQQQQALRLVLLVVPDPPQGARQQDKQQLQAAPGAGKRAAAGASSSSSSSCSSSRHRHSCAMQQLPVAQQTLALASQQHCLLAGTMGQVLQVLSRLVGANSGSEQGQQQQQGALDVDSDDVPGSPHAW
jgi:hypothetical protein